MLEITALRAKIAEMREFSLTQEMDIRDKVVVIHGHHYLKLDYFFLALFRCVALSGFYIRVLISSVPGHSHGFQHV